MEHFDLLLADIRMPDMDGLEVSRMVVHEHPDLRVIVITGYPSPESAGAGQTSRGFGLSAEASGTGSAQRRNGCGLGSHHGRPLPEALERLRTWPPRFRNRWPSNRRPRLPAQSVPTQVTQAMGIPARPATQDISAATAFLVLLGSP